MTQDLALSTQDFYAHMDKTLSTLSTVYGEKPVRSVQMDMAWHTEGEKVRAVGITWTIRPSKGGHKTTTLGAHYVSNDFSDEL